MFNDIPLNLPGLQMVDLHMILMYIIGQWNDTSLNDGLFDIEK